MLATLGAASLSGILAGACGNAAAPELESTPTVADTVPKKAAKPRDPAQELPVPIVVPESAALNSRNVGQATMSGPVRLLLSDLTRATSRAAGDSDSRYSYPINPLESNVDSRWSFATALKNMPPDEAAIVLFDQIDLDDLVRSEMLLPLDGFLEIDPNFHPEHFWPRVLDTGKHEGLQYAIPVAVAPWTIMFYDAIAKAAGVDPPPPRTFDRASLLQTALAIKGKTPIPSYEKAVGLNLATFRTQSAEDFDTFLPSLVFLHAELGNLRIGTGDYSPLKTEAARETAQFIYDLAHEHGLLSPIDDQGPWANIYWKNIMMNGWMLHGNDTSWFRGFATDRVRIYPFPVQVGSRYPVEVWGMVGISARAPDTELIYPAFRTLADKLNEVAPIPAVKVDQQAITNNVLMGTSGEHQLLVDVLMNASFIQ